MGQLDMMYVFLKVPLHSGKSKTIGTEITSVVSRDDRREERKIDYEGKRELLEVRESILPLNCVCLPYTIVYVYQNSLNYLPPKSEFTVSKLCFSKSDL